jgi:hypothetical protein
MQKVDTLTHSGIVNQDDIPDQVIVELLNENIFDNNNNNNNPDEDDMIPHADDDSHYMDVDELNLSMSDDDDDDDQSQGPLNLSDLNVTDDSMNGNTTFPDESLNQSSMSVISLPSNLSENDSVASEVGGRKRRRKTQRKSKKGKKGKKGKKTRKQRGGMCYGNGVGANSYDPNYSIYNTRQLELFPYRPK